MDGANQQTSLKIPAYPLVVLHGATASGKTSLAIQLAQRFSGEIVSCDSVAVYRELEIGTAKPSREQRALVPHHMLDVVWPNQPYTAGDYARDARANLADIESPRQVAHCCRRNWPVSAGADRRIVSRADAI